MSTAELNTAKIDLVRYMLNETDMSVIEQLMLLVYGKKKTTAHPKNLSAHLGKLKRGIDGWRDFTDWVAVSFKECCINRPDALDRDNWMIFSLLSESRIRLRLIIPQKIKTVCCSNRK